MSGLTATDLTVVRQGRRALDGVCAAFGAGRLTVVIGPNGAGKSTLLACLAGLLAPAAGEVRLGDTQLAALHRRELARRRAFLPQGARAEWPISVARVVALGLGVALPVFGDPDAAAAGRVAEALAACDLTHLAQRPATTLSGGERARAMLARAIVGDPEVLIVDEPTAGLDPRHAIDALRRLRARADAGRTVVVALHDLDLALRYADDAVALRGGRVVASGPAQDVLCERVLAELYDVRVRIMRDEDGAAIRYLP
jgi:iron complex transport system ATP-binding protein